MTGKSIIGGVEALRGKHVIPVFALTMGLCAAILQGRVQCPNGFGDWHGLLGIASISARFIAVEFGILSISLLAFSETRHKLLAVPPGLPALVLHCAVFVCLVLAVPMEIVQDGTCTAAHPAIAPRIALLAAFLTLLATVAAALLPALRPGRLPGGVVRLFVALSFVSIAYDAQNYISHTAITSVIEGITLNLSLATYAAMGQSAPHFLPGTSSTHPIIWLGDISFTIAPSCAGVQGMGIAAAVLCAYIYLERKSLRIGRSLAFAGGACCLLFLLNAARIALLLLVARKVSPEVALNGFHSYFGILTSLIVVALALLAYQGPFFARAGVTEPSPPRPVDPVQKRAGASERPFLNGDDTVLLLPLAAVLVLQMVLGLGSAEFNWLYPFQLLGGAIIIWRFWPVIRSQIWHPLSVVGVAAGVGVYVLWLLLVPDSAERDYAMQTALERSKPALAGVWIMARAVGCSLLAPLVEELAFRGGVMRILSRSMAPYRKSVVGRVGPLVLSSLAFALLHTDFLAALVAGLIYGVLAIRAKSIAPAFHAHMITNFLISVQAVALGQWSYW